MFHACAARFDVTGNHENFLVFGWTKQGLSRLINFNYLNFSRIKRWHRLLTRSLRSRDRSAGQGRSVMCSSRQDAGSGNNGACKDGHRRKQAISLAMQGNHVPDTYLHARARLPAGSGTIDWSCLVLDIHDFVQRRVWYWRTCMQWRLELRVCRRRGPCMAACSPGPCLLPRKFYKIFLDSSSHQNFKHMHEVLNIDENKN